MLHILIPVHNRLKYTVKCLDSLRQQTNKEFQTIVIDDGSTDNTAEVLNSEYPEVIVLKGNGQLFWTKGINLGITYALQNNSQLILTLNNDTLAAPNFIEKMLSAHRKKPDALLGAFALDAKSFQPVYTGENINWITHRYKALAVQPPKQQGLKQVSHFPGRGLLIPAKVFHKIGLFDEKNFPHYLADYDFTHQAIKNGFLVFCNYDARLFIYPEESGNAIIRNRKNLNNYYNHLFTLKGGGNLKYFTRYAVKNCPVRFLPSFLLIGYTRRIFGYFLK